VKQVLVVAPGKIEFIDVVEPALGPRDVRVVITHSGLSSRSEIERYQRNYAGKPEPIGYNMVGVVDRIGDAVSTVAIGDRVHVSVGHADIVVVDERKVIKLPDGVDEESGCFVYLPTLGTHALRLAGYTPGQYVAIIGQGIIGQTAALMAQHFGARTIVIDISDDRLAQARNAGAHLALNPLTDDVKGRVADYCGKAGLDIVIDTASSWRSLALGFDLIRHGGRVVELGIIRDAPTPEETAIFFESYRRNLHGKEAVLIGASNDSADPEDLTGQRFTRERNIQEVLSHVATGALDLRQLITHRYPIEDLETVYRLLLDGGGKEHLGVIFTWPAAGTA
jgi:threonine dehydrogenase-like Zn-dependent dehydrogenase